MCRFFFVFDDLVTDWFDYLPSFFFAGSAEVAGEATDAVVWATGALGWATTGAWTGLTGAAFTTGVGAACTTGVGAATSTGCGVLDRLRSRSSLISVGAASIVSWIFFKIFANESWPEWEENKYKINDWTVAAAHESFEAYLSSRFDQLPN